VSWGSIFHHDSSNVWFADYTIRYYGCMVMGRAKSERPLMRLGGERYRVPIRKSQKRLFDF
jgi:hypothetical protein